MGKRSELLTHATSASVGELGRVFRTKSLFAIAIVAIVPPLGVILFAIGRLVSERTMTLAFAWWALTISAASCLIALAPALQRIVFVSDLAGEAIRWRLWALGVYGISIVGFCFGL